MARVFLGLGSNDGDRLAHLSLAATRLAAAPGIVLVQMAPIIETEPVGGPPQPLFLNTVVEIETAIEPRFQEHFVNASAIPNAVDTFPELSQIVTLPDVSFNTSGSGGGRRRRG